MLRISLTHFHFLKIMKESVFTSIDFFPFRTLKYLFVDGLFEVAVKQSKCEL